nr:hypothetical protein [Tanacetum cinerariifolium]
MDSSRLLIFLMLIKSDGKKVVITEASIRHDLKLNDAEGTLCIPNAVIFEELARMGTMASAIICLANNQKFNFLKYILDNLKMNLEAGVPFYMFPRFIQVFMNHQIGDMSHHKGIYVNPSLTKKVFANIKRVGIGFSRAVTPLFGKMMRKHKPRRKEGKETKVSPTELHTEDHVPTTSNDPLPSGEDRIQLKELMFLCTNLSNKVLDLENKVIEMKSSHKAKIAELESKMEKLEEENMSLIKELKSINTMVESLAIKETVVDKEELSKKGRKITNIDADAEVNLENVYNLDMAHEETVLSMQDVTDADVKEVVKEMVEVITTSKIIVDEVSTAGGKLNAANEEPVSAAPTNITTAQPSEATNTIVDITTAPKAKGIVFHDMEESITRTASSKSQVKDKGKAKQSDAVRKYQALKRKHVSIAQARKNMMIYLKNMVGFKMDFFKGVSYEEIRPLFEAEYNKFQTLFKESPKMDAERIIALRKRTKKEKVEKDQTVKKQKGNELEQDNTEKQKLEEQQEAEELKSNLEIVPDDEDDVFVNVTPLSSKPPKIMDYKIYKEGKNEHFQIIRANDNHHMYFDFSTILKNFDKEDLEMRLSIRRGDSLVRATTANSSLEAEQDSDNIDKTQTKATSNKPSFQELVQTAQQTKIDGLERRVKKLEKKQRSRTQKLKRLYKVGLTARVISSSDDEALDKEDTSKQERIDEINADEDIAL